jgi:hypothetical protein
MPARRRQGALDGDVPEVQAEDPQERQPREARLDVVSQDLPRSFCRDEKGLTLDRRSRA